MIFNMTGGGQPLNFKVVGNPQPTSPSENTIWLNTDVPIASWYFQAEQPENMAQGDVWFPVGTSSAVEFNALKKNGIQVYPLSANQMVSGALVDKTAKSWQGGKWVDWWNGELYKNGNQYENITGGWWQNTGLYYESFTNQKPVTFGNEIAFSVPDGYSSNATTKKKINLSGYNYLYFDFEGSNGDISKVFIHSIKSGRIDNGNYAAVATSSPVNISGLNSEYYISIVAWNGRYPKYNNIRLVK